MNTNEQSGLRLSLLWESGETSRSTVFELLKIAGIKTTMRRVSGSQRPAAFLTSEQEQIMRALIYRINNGETVSQIKNNHASDRIGMPDVDLSSVTLPEAIAIVVEAWLEAQECHDLPPAEPTGPARVVA